MLVRTIDVGDLEQLQVDLGVEQRALVVVDARAAAGHLRRDEDLAPLVCAQQRQRGFGE